MSENNARNRNSHVFTKRRSNENWTNEFRRANEIWKKFNVARKIRNTNAVTWELNAHNVFHVNAYRRPISNVNTQRRFVGEGEMPLSEHNFSSIQI